MIKIWGPTVIEPLLKVVVGGGLGCSLGKIYDIICCTGYPLEDICPPEGYGSLNERWNSSKEEKLLMLIELVCGLLMRLCGGDPYDGTTIGKGHAQLSSAVCDHNKFVVKKTDNLSKLEIAAKTRARRGYHRAVEKKILKYIKEMIKTKVVSKKNNPRGDIPDGEERLIEFARGGSSTTGSYENRVRVQGGKFAE